MRRIGVAVLFVGCLSAWLPVAAHAQVRPSITGVVQDKSGGVLPGVSVEVASPVLIEQSRSAVTDASGRYAITDLRPGTYTVTFTLPGFTTFKREGIELTGSFVSPVNASLVVGALSETITVTGSSPVVDTVSTRTQVVIDQAVLRNLPVMRSIQDQANLVPGVVSRSTSAGQILSDFYINSIVARGATDQHISYDGMPNDMMLGAGTQAIAGGVNELGQAEMVYDIGGHSAESPTAGVRMDAIPKDGGNLFSGTWRVFGSNSSLQSDNLNDALKKKITSVNKLDFNWDHNIAVGGPIIKNKLWYFGAFELSQFNILVANVYFKDGSQADTGGHVKPNLTSRLTYQATPADKVTFQYNNTTSATDRYDFNATTTPEAGLKVGSPTNYSGIVKWTRTATNRLLLEAGQSMAASTYKWDYQPENGPFDLPHINATTGITSVATSIAPVDEYNKSFHTIANATYVTGSHALKGGMTLDKGWARTQVDVRRDVRYLVFVNFVPNVPSAFQVGVTNSPVTAHEDLTANLGIFGQDQWTRKRLTLTGGARYDYINAALPDQTAPAGQFVAARSANAISCLPCWNDWSARFGASYDLFGNGKTAVKTSFGKYLASQALARAESANPIRSSFESRNWTDLDGNGSVLDAAGNAQYNEIGPSSNKNFGLPVGATRFDGTTPRPTNWEETVSVVHELLPRVAVTAGYYHRSFQNQALTRNLAVDTVGDYAPYSITAPLDPRLPTSGEVIPRFNLALAKSGVVDNVSTFSTLNTRLYNGFEVSVNARVRQSGFLVGGITTQHTTTTDCDLSGINPDNGRFCKRDNPFRTLYKASGGYTLPYQIQVSGSLQAVPGSDVAANFTYNGAYAGVALTTSNSRSVNLLAPNTTFLDYQTQLDARASRTFRIGGRRRMQGYVDMFNLLNSAAVVSVNQTIGSGGGAGFVPNATYLDPLVVLQARRFQFGARFDF